MSFVDQFEQIRKAQIAAQHAMQLQAEQARQAYSAMQSTRSPIAEEAQQGLVIDGVVRRMESRDLTARPKSL